MHITRFLPLSLFVALACPTDPGDVGSESMSNSGSAEGDDAADDDPTAGDDDDDDGGTGNSASATQGDDDVADDDDDAGSNDDASDDSVTDDGAPTTEDSGGTESGSGDDGSSESGTQVADCSECGPDEGCVAETAFTIEYFCVPIPEACGMEFDCACASEYCVEPFTLCTDFPDPPQRAIACECITC